MDNYKTLYESFWKEIVEDENGNLDKEAVMKELFDYRVIMDHCAAAYRLISNNAVINIGVTNKALKRVVQANFKDMFDKYEDYESLKKAIEEYFDFE